MGEKFNLTGKNAIITGGGSGIGEAIATVLAQQGATTNILDVNKEKGEHIVEKIAQQGGKAKYFPCDVSNLHQVQQVFKKACSNGHLDILVNNAGIAHIGTAESTTETEFAKILSVNVYGVFFCIQAGIPFMKKNGGAIINISSIVAQVGIPQRFAYTMSKGAVHGMTLSVAKDYLDCNIRCNSIAPGRVHTPFVDGYLANNYPGKEQEMFEKLSKTQPIGRMGKPEEIANLVLYLSSSEASFITGSCFPIDGGFITLNN